MKILIIFIAVISTNTLLSQKNIFHEKEFTLLSKKSEYQTMVFSAGAGVIKVFGMQSSSSESSVLFLFTLNSTVHLYKPWYVGLGLDIYKEPRNAPSTLYSLTLTPSLRLNFGNNTTSLWLGAGGVVNFYNNDQTGSTKPVSAGTVFSIKYQYNMDKNMSAGIELKIPMIMTYNLGYSVLLLNFYISGGIY